MTTRGSFKKWFHYGGKWLLAGVGACAVFWVVLLALLGPGMLGMIFVAFLVIILSASLVWTGWLEVTRRRWRKRR